MSDSPDRYTVLRFPWPLVGILVGAIATGLVLAAGLFTIGIEIVDGHEDIAA